MNLGEIQNALCDRLGIARADPNFNSLNLYIDETYREILSMKGIGRRLRIATLPFTTVASTSTAALPQAVTSIASSIVDRLNRRVYNEVTLAYLRERDPGMADSSSAPYLYAVLGMSDSVAIDPPSACELFVVSDSASDAGGTTVHVEGVTSNGQARRASVSLAGLTSVSVNSAITTWQIVTKFYLTATAQGSVTLAAAVSGGTELARIAPGRSYARYTRLSIYPQPSSIITLYADVELNIDPLVSTYDQPVLPEDFHWLLVTGASMREYLKRQRLPQYDRELVRWRRGISDMRSYLQRPSGPSNTAGLRGYSQLGPYFPAGS